MSDSIDKKLLREAADKEGFGLESKTASVFKSKSLSVQQNFLLPDGSDVDVFAYPQPNGRFGSIFIVECKGSSPDKQLLLFDKSREFIKECPSMHQGVLSRLLYQLRYEAEKGFCYFSPDPTMEKVVMVCEQNCFPISLRYCHTGDFLTLTSKNGKASSYDKEPRQDERNNFFKGIMQILKAMPLLCDEIHGVVNNFGKTFLKVIPLIVTNAQISIRDFSHEEMVEVSWAVCRCNPLDTEANPARIEYVFVVNVNKLSEFIEKFG
jgi:hypothetical protein